jgi:hypothetical protein
MSSDESECKLCRGAQIIKLKCLMCQNPNKNKILQHKCDKCVASSGYVRTFRCDDYCRDNDYNDCNEVKKAHMGTSRERVQCYNCDADMKECTKCKGKGFMCHLCSNTGKMEQWCPLCIIKGDVKVIED